MKTFSVGELKANFSKVLDDIKIGERIVISFGKQKEKLAVIVPYKSYTQKSRRLGLLDGKAGFKIHKDFSMTDEEFLAS